MIKEKGDISSGEPLHKPLARFLGPIVSGFLYDLAKAAGAFYGSAILTFIAFFIALSMRRTTETWQS